MSVVVEMRRVLDILMKNMDISTNIRIQNVTFVHVNLCPYIDDYNHLFLVSIRIENRTLGYIFQNLWILLQNIRI